MATFTSKLTSQGLSELAKKLEEYATVTLRDKVRLFRSNLASVGISAAMTQNDGSYSMWIVFWKEDTDHESVIVARETTLLAADWLGHEDVMVSPLLMTEFGSGNYAVYWEKPFGGSDKVLDDGTPIGRGSFPNQKNAFKQRWYYKDTGGITHITRGWMPTRPMHHAVIEMITQVESIAREVFRYGG